MKDDIIISEKEIQAMLDENGVFYFPDEGDSPIEMDSLTFVSLIISMEEKYDVDISAEYLVEPPDTYRKLVDFLMEAIRGKKP